MAMCQAAKEVVWFTSLLDDFSISLQIPTIIFDDSQSAITLTQNPVSHLCFKHILIQYHFARELVQNGRVTVKYIPTKIMIADTLIKLLPHPQYNALIELMGVFKKNQKPNGCQQ